MKKQAKDLMAQIALAQGAAGWRQAVQVACQLAAVLAQMLFGTSK